MRFAASIGVVMAMSTAALAQEPAAPAPAPPAPVAPAPAVAKGPNHDACLEGVRAFDASFYAPDETPTAPCSDLAHIVRARFVEAAVKTKAKPVASDVEPPPTGTAGNQDSAGQTSAVASGEPVAQTGGTVGLAGTAGSGLQLVTALAVNPVGAAADPDEYKRYAWGSRAADISVVVPVGLDTGAVAREGFQYIGVHLRLNVSPLLGRSAQLVKAAEAAVGQFLTPSGAFIEALGSALERAADPAGCARAVIDRNEGAQRLACGAEISGAVVTDTFKAASAALAAAREEADRYYLTVEARGDWGDVNGDAAEADDSLLGAYVSAGLHVGDPHARFLAVRGRLGIATYEDGAMDTGVTAYYAAGGVDLGTSSPDGRFSLSLGFEKQWTTGGAAASTEFQNARLGITVPVAGGKRISVGVSVPAGGDDEEDREPVVVVNGDWATMFGP